MVDDSGGGRTITEFMFRVSLATQLLGHEALQEIHDQLVKCPEEEALFYLAWRASEVMAENSC